MESELTTLSVKRDFLNEKCEYLKSLLHYDVSSKPDSKNLFIEIGGPSTHVKIYIETEQEKELLSQCVNAIIETRLIETLSKLTKECKKYVN